MIDKTFVNMQWFSKEEMEVLSKNIDYVKKKKRIKFIQKKKSFVDK